MQYQQHPIWRICIYIISADNRPTASGWISGTVKHRFFRRQRASFRACKLLFSVSSEFFTHLCTCRYLFDFYTLFSCNPAVFLETSGFFQITTPRVLFLPSQQPPSQIPETARTAGRCDCQGGAHDPAALSCFAASSIQAPYLSPRRRRQVSSIPLHLLFRPNPLRWASVEFLCRTSAQRPFFWCWASTRSA